MTVSPRFDEDPWGQSYAANPFLSDAPEVAARIHLDSFSQNPSAANPSSSQILDSDKVVVLPSIANEMMTKLSSLFRLEPYLKCPGPAEHANT